MSTPKRSAFEQSPPIERAATSRMYGPPGPSRSSAWIGPCRSPNAADGPLDRLDDRLLRLLGVARRRDVDRLLEERAVERVRLVEEGQHAQRASVEQPFQRHLRPRDERLDHDLPLARRRRRPASPRSARTPCTNSAGSLARITPRLADCADRLQDARIRRPLRLTAGVGVDGDPAERRARQPGLLERPPREVLVAGDPGRVDRVGDQPEPRGGLRRDDRRGVVDVDDGVERALLGDLARSCVAERAGRARSRPIWVPPVRRESGPRSSDPTTTSTPSRRAAVMNAFARYVLAAISSSTRRGASRARRRR